MFLLRVGLKAHGSDDDVAAYLPDGFQTRGGPVLRHSEICAWAGCHLRMWQLKAIAANQLRAGGLAFLTAQDFPANYMRVGGESHVAFAACPDSGSILVITHGQWSADVSRVLAQYLYRHDLKRADMGRVQVHTRRAAFVVGL